MSLKCAYHPDRDATDKCEKCGKVICLECKMVYHETHRYGSGDSSYTYSKRYELCPVCFYDRKIRKYGFSYIISAIIFTIFMIIFIVLTQTVIFAPSGFPEMDKQFQIFRWLFTIIPIILLVVVDIYAFFIGPTRAKGFKEKKSGFLNSLASAGPIIEEKIANIFCSECGNKLDPGSTVCSYCGSIIKD